MGLTSRDGGWMLTCARSHCRRPALATWWQLCLECSEQLLSADDEVPVSAVDQSWAAGSDALDWAERIAPAAWGQGTQDPWLLGQRVLAMAALVTGRSTGCPHTASTDVGPVVMLPSSPGVLGCPACMEQTVTLRSTGPLGCDRCGGLVRPVVDRAAVVTGTSLIVVAHLCTRCRSDVLEFASAL